MKYLLFGIGIMIVSGVQGQSIIGTWQQVENKTCFESQLPAGETATEQELTKEMGSTSQTGVAKLIKFDAKGRGEEGIFSQGHKKGNDLTGFQYTVNGQELILLDKKSGMMTQHFIIEELTDVTLRFHDAKKDCEVRSFSRVK